MRDLQKKARKFIGSAFKEKLNK